MAAGHRSLRLLGGHFQDVLKSAGKPAESSVVQFLLMLHWSGHAWHSAPVISASLAQAEVWPQHVAGGAGVMQDPHVLHFLGGASIVMMDVATLKCSGSSQHL